MKEYYITVSVFNFAFIYDYFLSVTLDITFSFWPFRIYVKDPALVDKESLLCFGILIFVQFKVISNRIRGQYQIHESLNSQSQWYIRTYRENFYDNSKIVD